MGVVFGAKKATEALNKGDWTPSNGSRDARGDMFADGTRSIEGRRRGTASGYIGLEDAYCYAKC